eukprot:gi/632946834/ref/XP_007888754.1/ PREDICTED: zinc finger protein ZXDC-like [Callorhinchus milii]
MTGEVIAGQNHWISRALIYSSKLSSRCLSCKTAGNHHSAGVGKLKRRGEQWQPFPSVRTKANSKGVKSDRGSGLRGPELRGQRREGGEEPGGQGQSQGLGYSAGPSAGGPRKAEESQEFFVLFNIVGDPDVDFSLKGTCSSDEGPGPGTAAKAAVASSSVSAAAADYPDPGSGAADKIYYFGPFSDESGLEKLEEAEEKPRARFGAARRSDGQSVGLLCCAPEAETEAEPEPRGQALPGPEYRPPADANCQAGAEDGLTGGPGSPEAAADLAGQGTFAGTITINNKNLIVRIENGVLTLAAPGGDDGDDRGDGCHVKGEGSNGVAKGAGGALSLSGGINNNNNSSSSSSSSDDNNNNNNMVVVHYHNSEKPPECHRACASAAEGGGSAELRASEPGLTAVDGEPSAYPDPRSASASGGASRKDFEGGPLSSGAGSSIGICPESGTASFGNFIITESGDVLMKLSENLGIGKKGPGEMYHCPEQSCDEVFDKKHKLKVHLLSHTERPFKCTIEGCEWSFTTSYKLKRHQQSHVKLRPFTCEVAGCGKKFTTVYNLKAHTKAHVQENSFVCEVCSEPFSTAVKLSSHQRTHFEPQRPYKCDFPGCEKTFITISALGSHNRSHFREQEHFTCSFPGCDKRYDKACRLKIHMRSHTGERPFICDFDGCGWSFTCMSKLLRHKRTHEDDRRFVCLVDDCGKSFTRAEHLKGHSITHLGTRPFVCPVEGCEAKFSARSSLYIHAKKHLEEDYKKTRCPLTNCNKVFNSKHSIKTHMMKQHNISPDLFSQLEMTGSLTPSNELTSSSQGDLSSLDIASLFSGVPVNPVGISSDMSLVSSGILTIDAASVGSTLGGTVSVNNSSMGQTIDPLIVAATDMSHAIDSTLGLTNGGPVLQHSTLSLDGVQTVNTEALGSLASLSIRTPSSCQDLHSLSSGSALTVDTATLTPSSSLGNSHVPELLSPTKVDRHVLNVSDVMSQQEGSKVVTQFVFSNLNTPTGSFSAQKELELNMVSGCSFLESGGSARTDYRAIQLAKKRKQKTGNSLGPGNCSCTQRKKASKVTSASHSRFGNVIMPTGGLTIRDPTTGTHYVQTQLLQDDPSGDGDLAFQLTTQSSTSHSQLTADLPVNILQESHPSTEDDGGSSSQFTSSTINLQDLE